MCFIKYRTVVNEKLKAQAKLFLLVCQNWMWKPLTELKETNYLKYYKGKIFQIYY